MGDGRGIKVPFPPVLKRCHFDHLSISVCLYGGAPLCPFLIIHLQICREVLRLFHSVPCRGEFLLIGVACSPCLSELNVISVIVKYHHLFANRASPAWIYSLLTYPNPSQASSAFHFATLPLLQ